MASGLMGRVYKSNGKTQDVSEEEYVARSAAATAYAGENNI